MTRLFVTVLDELSPMFGRPDCFLFSCLSFFFKGLLVNVFNFGLWCGYRVCIYFFIFLVIIGMWKSKDDNVAFPVSQTLLVKSNEEAL